MFCPSCNYQLSPLSIRRKTGPVIIDYCGNCGGVWADHLEINFLHEEDLKGLAHVLPKATSKPLSDRLVCPKDRGILEITRGENVPATLTIFSCPKCRGNFFPAGTLIPFKQAQEAKINYFKLWQLPLASISTVLLPLFLLFLVGAGIGATYIVTTQNFDSRTRASEFISTPTVLYPHPDAVVITFTTQQPATTKILYWKENKSPREITLSTKATTKHAATLRNLEKGTTYSYEIEILTPQQIKSPVYTFITK